MYYFTHILLVNSESLVLVNQQYQITIFFFVKTKDRIAYLSSNYFCWKKYTYLVETLQVVLLLDALNSSAISPNCLFIKISWIFFPSPFFFFFQFISLVYNRPSSEHCFSDLPMLKSVK